MLHEKSVSGGVKFILRLEGFCVLVTACLLYHHFDYSWKQFFLLFFIPDISFLGYLAGPLAGAFTYNLLHSYTLPLLLGGIFYIQDINTATPYLLIWFAHIGFDRFLGYGLKYATGFSDTHLGKIGKWKR